MRLLLLTLTLLCGPLAVAQDLPQLLVLNTEIGLGPDGFGGQMPVVEGEVFNHGVAAYSGISIFVEALDADDEVIGEGFGYLVDACGTALLDYAVPPGRMQTFSAPFELFAEGEVANIKLSVDARAAPVERSPDVVAPAVQRIAQGEVVMLEWLDEERLIFGVGCAGDVFTELDWWRYNFSDGSASEIEHPDAARVTPEMIELSDATLVSQSGERNPELYFSSQMTYSPTARRVVYQNDLHSIYSAEPDGSYRRVIHRNLGRRSLRGFIWARNPGVFLAYYFGSYGEPVYYFTADVDGQMRSAWLENLPPSIIVPGPAPDGYAAVVGRQDGDASGYYWQALYGDAKLLFDAELPGNNYPAPVVTRNEIYIIRPVESAPTLQCFSRQRRDLTTISALPLPLTRGSRAWAWLSPAGGKLALGLNGVDGGLWWVETGGGCA
ncbi:MAG: hypothetical protein OXG78_00645 [Chloroflexi bacterium]|nr:hypothetical protein [Chloroflexota bacterium]